MANRRHVYMDYAATTPLDPEVLAAMLPWLKDDFGNPSSVHSLGRRARGAIEASRERVASLLDAAPSEIIFTSGGTEANNLALVGAVGPDSVLVTSRVEHEAVLRPVERLAKRGCEVRYAPVRNDGTVDPADVDRTLGEASAKRKVVSLMHVNNETGAMNDLATIAAVARRAGAVMHTDAVQSVGLTNVSVEAAGVDLLSLSGHKIYGPKGIGVLYVRSGVDIQSQLLGGAQERSRRAGTENVAAIVGLALALQKTVDRRKERAARIGRLRDLMIQFIRDKLGDGVSINTPTEEGRVAPHIVNVSVREDAVSSVDGEMLLLGLDVDGVLASSGSACSSGALRPSHVLTALGRTRDEATAAVRFSLGVHSTEEDIAYTVDRLAEIVRRLRDVARRPGLNT